ncbi:MAG: glycosyltransferase family 9 protein [Vicinamibacterales bacterium]|nr:glycosyltransferase family 9 protein [Vicinamibacterales bacterium]
MTTAEGPRHLPDRPSVLVILLGSLGDIARALPLLSILRHERPHARLTWAVGERWRDLAVVHPAADRIVVFPQQRTPATLARFIRDLRSERYDVALDLQRILKSGLCARLSGAPRRVGFHPTDAKEFNHCCNTEWIPAHPPHVPKWRHYLAFAKHLGLPVPGTLSFGLEALSGQGGPAAIQALRGGFVAVVVGSSWPSKDWSIEGYRTLIARILGRSGCSVVLTGAAAHRPVSEDLLDTGSDGARLVNLVGRTTLTELVATLGAARAAVGPDTGAGHLAAAVGTPYVTLLGPTPPSRVAPFRCEALAVTTPAPCECVGRRTCRRRSGRCMDTITAEAVWETLGPLIARGVRLKPDADSRPWRPGEAGR